MLLSELMQETGSFVVLWYNDPSHVETLIISRCYWPVGGQDETEAGRESGLHGLRAPLKLSQVFFCFIPIKKFVSNTDLKKINKKICSFYLIINFHRLPKIISRNENPKNVTDTE